MPEPGPGERAIKMTETSGVTTKDQTGADQAPTGRQQPLGGSVTEWLIDKEPNGMYRCEAHFVEPVRAWDGLYAAKWTWAQNSPEEAASGLLPWLRHQRVDIPDDLLAFAEQPISGDQPAESVQP